MSDQPHVSKPEMFGVLNIDKPSGKTSRDVVDRVQRLVRPAKAGHAGTLDPLATGVLVVCVGPATRLIEYVQRSEKSYRATFLFGRHSPTDDVDGEITMIEGTPPEPTLGAIEQALTPLIGRVNQRPPAFSALKVQGRRAYELARRGELVELKARPVDIYALDVVSYEYPELVLEIRCGSGTYVCAVGRDLAESLGTQAVMSALVRTAIGEFRLEDACRPDQLTAETIGAQLQNPLVAVASLPRLPLSSAEIGELRQGRSITARLLAGAEVAAINEAGRLVAILVPREEGRLGPRLNFVSATESGQ